MGLELYDTVAAAEAGRPLKLPNPSTLKETGEYITFHGADSATYKATIGEFAKANKRLGRELTDEEREAQDIESLARMTVGWNLTENGKPLAFSHEEALRVYRQYPSIRKRATIFIFTEANFFGTASAT